MSSQPSEANEPLIGDECEHRVSVRDTRWCRLRSGFSIDKVGIGALVIVLVFGLGVATGKYIPVDRGGLLGMQCCHSKDPEC